MMKTMLRRSEFTMIELLAVVSIIAHLAGLVLPAIQSSRERGKLARWLTWKNQMRNDSSLIILYDFQNEEPKKLNNRAFGLDVANYQQEKLDGAISNCKWGWGRFKGKPALLFNGVNSYVQIPTETRLGEILGDMSLSLWFKPYALTSNELLMRFYGDSASTSNLDLSLRGGTLRLDYYAFVTTSSNSNAGPKSSNPGKGPPAGKGYLKNRDKTTLTAEVEQFSPTFKANRWYNVILVYSADDLTLKLYLNGKYVEEQTLAGEIYFYFGKACLGGLPTAGQSFNGLIDEIDVFNKALTQREITSYYSMSAPAQE